MATSVAASLAPLEGEETWRFCFHVVSLVNTPPMPHEEAVLRVEQKQARLKALNGLLNKLPAFQTAMKRMHETQRPADVGGRADPKSSG